MARYKVASLRLPSLLKRATDPPPLAYGVVEGRLPSPLKKGSRLIRPTHDPPPHSPLTRFEWWRSLNVPSTRRGEEVGPFLPDQAQPPLPRDRSIARAIPTRRATIASGPVPPLTTTSHDAHTHAISRTHTTHLIGDRAVPRVEELALLEVVLYSAGFGGFM